MQTTRRRKKRRYRLTPLGRIVFFGVPIAVLILVIFLVTINANKLVDSITVEAGTELPSAESFLKKDNQTATYITDISTIDISQIGSHEIIIEVDGKEYKTSLKIADTIAPVITTKDVTSWNGKLVNALDFIDHVEDATDVTAVFITAPNYTLASQEVSIKFIDEGGNAVTQTATLYIDTDTEAPLILGAADQTIYIGKAVSYKRNVTCTDDKDGEVTLTVDNTNVDIETVGDYEVTYTATDEAGNASSVTVTFTVREDDGESVDPDLVDSLADDVLAGIFKTGMTDLERVEAIYEWVVANVTYTTTSDKGDWTKEAYRGLTQKRGDCFTFYAVTQELLTRAGIQNMRIQRETDAITTRHYWNLVNIGDGWYHLDTCPHFKTARFRCFMKTDAQLVEYTEPHRSDPEIYYYYTFNGDLYPDRATEEIN